MDEKVENAPSNTPHSKVEENPTQPSPSQGEGVRRSDGRPHVVIIGGGFGGLAAAKGLRNAPVRITLVDKTNHHLFQPLLYQVATAGLSPADIAAPIRGVLGKQENCEVVLAEVLGVDLEHSRVILDGRTVDFDYLIVATGATHSYFGHDEWAKYAPGLKTISDATAIRRDILVQFERAETEPDAEKRKSLMTFVLVGAGPTGVEMAGAIAELAHQALKRDFRHIDPKAARILLLEAGPRILAAFPESLASSAQRALERLEVEVRLNTMVLDIDENGVTAAGERIPSSMVIWTAGVVASPAGKWLGAETDRCGRVMVTPTLNIPGYPNVFVIGDTAHVEQDGKQLPGVCPVAMQQGAYVASVIRPNSGASIEPKPFRYWDKGNLATVGRSFAILQVGKIKMAGLLAWLAWIVIHIWYLISFRNRLVVMIQWAWAYFTFQRGARLIPPEANERVEMQIRKGGS